MLGEEGREHCPQCPTEPCARRCPTQDPCPPSCWSTPSKWALSLSLPLFPGVCSGAVPSPQSLGAAARLSPCAGNADEGAAQGALQRASSGMQSSPWLREPDRSAGAGAQLVKLIESEEGWQVPTASPLTRSRAPTLSTKLGFLIPLHCWISRGKIFLFISLICVGLWLVCNPAPVPNLPSLCPAGGMW